MPNSDHMDDGNQISRREAAVITGLGGLAAVLVGGLPALAQDQAEGRSKADVAGDSASNLKDKVFYPAGDPGGITKSTNTFSFANRTGNLIIQWGVSLKNRPWITVDFPEVFGGTPVVVTTPYWSGANSPVAYIDTLDDVSRSGFRLGSGNQASNYYVSWIAIGRT